MRIAYIDESGDNGMSPKSPSSLFILSALVIDDSVWPDTFNRIIDIRRTASKKTGIRARTEYKGSRIRYGRGDFAKLGKDELKRKAFYSWYMRACGEGNPFEFINICIYKNKIRERDRDPRNHAWEFMLQRLQTNFSRAGGNGMIIHDEGHEKWIRTASRKFRRYSHIPSKFDNSPPVSKPFRQLIDDPSPRPSHESLLIQLSDMMSYALLRKEIPSGVWDAEIFEGLKEGGLLCLAASKDNDDGVVRWPKE